MSWDGTGIVCRIGGYCWKNWHGGLAQGCLNSKRKSADYKWIVSAKRDLTHT